MIDYYSCLLWSYCHIIRMQNPFSIQPKSKLSANCHPSPFGDQHTYTKCFVCLFYFDCPDNNGETQWKRDRLNATSQSMQFYAVKQSNINRGNLMSCLQFSIHPPPRTYLHVLCILSVCSLFTP